MPTCTQSMSRTANDHLRGQLVPAMLGEAEREAAGVRIAFAELGAAEGGSAVGSTHHTQRCRASCAPAPFRWTAPGRRGLDRRPLARRMLDGVIWRMLPGQHPCIRARGGHASCAFNVHASWAYNINRCPATAGVDGVSVSRLAGYFLWRICAEAAGLVVSAAADGCQCNLVVSGRASVAFSRRCTPATAGVCRSKLVVLIRGHHDRRGSQQVLVELPRPMLASNEERHACALEPRVSCEEPQKVSGALWE